jgi:poly(3-hydroxybutyrate) depolymerase
MLYQVREMQRSVLIPFSDWAQSMSKLYVNPYSPLSFLPFATRVSAGFELLHRLGKEYEKPEFGIKSTEIDGHEVTVAERIEVSKPFCRLLKFERLLPRALADRDADPTVLVFAPLSGHHATLLRDTVRGLLPDHNVYITDWIDARMVPVSHGPFHLHDYIAYAGVHPPPGPGRPPDVSVCQPTVPVLAAVSLMATHREIRSCRCR